MTEVKQSCDVSCALEHQERQWFNSSESDGLRHSCPPVYGLDKMDVPAQEGRENSPLLHHYILLGETHHRLTPVKPQWRGQIFSQSAGAISPRNTLRHTQK